MTKVEHLGNAPIFEAVIELQVLGSVAATKDFPTLVLKTLGNTYPTVSELTNTNNNFEISPKGVTATSSEPQLVGVHLISSDQKYFASLATDRFSISRVRPYEDWDKFLAEALRLWSNYQDLFKPAKISRIAVRYLNELVVPFPKDLKDLLKVSAALAPIGYPIAGFSSQSLVGNSERSDIHANLKVVSQAPTGNSGEFRFLVDIDAFRNGEIDTADVAMTLQVLKDLRDFKNRIFFDLLSDSLLARLK